MCINRSGDAVIQRDFKLCLFAEHKAESDGIRFLRSCVHTADAAKVIVCPAGGEWFNRNISLSPDLNYVRMRSVFLCLVERVFERAVDLLRVIAEIFIFVHDTDCRKRQFHHRVPAQIAQIIFKAEI